MNGELRARASTAIRLPDAEPRPLGRMKIVALRDVNAALDGASIASTYAQRRSVPRSVRFGVGLRPGLDQRGTGRGLPPRRGIPGWTLMDALGVADGDATSLVIEAVRAGNVTVISPNDFVNPHVKPWPVPTERQLDAPANDLLASSRHGGQEFRPPRRRST